MLDREVEPIVQSLIDQHGGATVHAAWLAVWGWPATWTPSLREALKVQEFLTSQPTKQKD
jgi:hypothetical protein